MRLTVIFLLLTTSAALAWSLHRPPAPAVSASATPVRASLPVPLVPAVQAVAERSAVGNLDQIDPAKMEITVTTSDGRMVFRVKSGATIRQGSRTMKPTELASHKGERVKVRYRDEGKDHLAHWIVLAAAAKRPPKLQ